MSYQSSLSRTAMSMSPSVDLSRHPDSGAGWDDAKNRETPIGAPLHLGLDQCACSKAGRARGAGTLARRPAAPRRTILATLGACISRRQHESAPHEPDPRYLPRPAAAQLALARDRNAI